MHLTMSIATIFINSTIRTVPRQKILNNNIDPVVTGSAAPTLRPPRCGPAMQAGMGWEAWLRCRLAREMFDNIQCSQPKREHDAEVEQ